MITCSSSTALPTTTPSQMKHMFFLPIRALPIYPAAGATTAQINTATINYSNQMATYHTCCAVDIALCNSILAAVDIAVDGGIAKPCFIIPTESLIVYV
jgi:hypothetical protein